MLFNRIDDWNGAYANGVNIAGGDRWPDAWDVPAKSYRDLLAAENRAQLDVAYGRLPRNKLDLFLPDHKPVGLVVYVHGGFWLRFDKSTWSHLARGAVERGYAVAMPSYTLCPEIRIGGIVNEVATAILHASSLVEGSIRLVGHSAGGHLVTRMICDPSPLPAEVRARVVHTVSISGVHDLRPMMRTSMNASLKIDDAEARDESPALLSPLPAARLTCWVGAAERSEFVRQNALLANIWTGVGATTSRVEELDRHHFNVVDGLNDLTIR